MFGRRRMLCFAPAVAGRWFDIRAPKPMGNGTSCRAPFHQISFALDFRGTSSIGSSRGDFTPLPASSSSRQLAAASPIRATGRWTLVSEGKMCADISILSIPTTDNALGTLRVAAPGQHHRNTGAFDELPGGGGPLRPDQHQTIDTAGQQDANGLCLGRRVVIM